MIGQSEKEIILAQVDLDKSEFFYVKAHEGVWQADILLVAQGTSCHKTINRAQAREIVLALTQQFDL